MNSQAVLGGLPAALCVLPLTLTVLFFFYSRVSSCRM